MCFKNIFKTKGSTIEEIIAAESAGMDDKAMSKYASQIDQIVYDLLLKVEVQPVEITIAQWETAARAQYPGFNNIELPDNKLYTVTLGEVQAVLTKDWTNLVKYVKEMFDCDDFASLLTARLATYYGITAVREVWGKTTSGSHAFCLGVFAGGDGFIARLIEPQTDDIFITEGPLGIYSPEKTK